MQVILNKQWMIVMHLAAGNGLLVRHRSVLSGRLDAQSGWPRTQPAVGGVKKIGIGNSI